MADTSTAMRETKAVDAYLNYCASEKRGNPGLTLEQLEAKIKAETRLYVKVELIAKRQALAAAGTQRAEDLEEAFVKYAPGFSDRKGITYAAWREMNVPVPVLQRAGLAPNNPGHRTIKQAGGTRVRNRMTHEFCAEVVDVYRRLGVEAVVARWGYKPDYVPQLVQRAEAKWPDLAQ